MSYFLLNEIHIQDGTQIGHVRDVLVVMRMQQSGMKAQRRGRPRLNDGLDNGDEDLEKLKQQRLQP